MSLLSAIHDLIAQVSDLRLRERLAAEWAIASKEKKFGLVFEDHLPELLPLYKARPRRGDLVCRRDGSLKDVWQVQQVKDGMANCIKSGDTAQALPARATEHGVTAELARWAVDELLVVRQFGEPIFPSLVPVEAVANGPADAPWHTLIEADNYHALQLLECEQFAAQRRALLEAEGAEFNVRALEDAAKALPTPGKKRT